MGNESVARPRRKPATLTWGVDDRVPARPLIVLAAQHTALVLVFLVYPLVAAGEAGLSTADTAALLSTTIVAVGIATMLQCWARGPGSGYLVIHFPNPIQIPAAMQALAAGGIGLLAGMSVVCGLFQIGVARAARLLRSLLPPEVCGVAVTMLGVSLVAPGLRRVLGEGTGNAQGFDPASVATSLVTLALIVLIVVFGGRLLKLFAVPLAMGAGWVLAAALGLTAANATALIDAVPIVALPDIALPSFAFDAALLPVFLLAGLITAIDTLGLMLSVERMNDADWRRADMARASRGMQVDGFGTLLSGAFGGFPTACSSSHVGLAFATGAAARSIGVAAGALTIVAAFFPKLVIALTTVPEPIVGAVLLYASVYLIVSGMELIASRRLSDRRIFVVGLSVILGLTVEFVPFVYAGMPAMIHPIFGSPLSLAVTCAILLNLLFRIGISRQAQVEIAPGAPALPIVRDFLERQGDLWGARRDIVAAAIAPTAQAIDGLLDSGLSSGAAQLRGHFDEINLDVTIAYLGEPLPPPRRGLGPSPEDLLGDRASVARFVSQLLGLLADRVTLGRDGPLQTLTLRFEH